MLIYVVIKRDGVAAICVLQLETAVQLEVLRLCALENTRINTDIGNEVNRDRVVYLCTMEEVQYINGLVGKGKDTSLHTPLLLAVTLGGIHMKFQRNQIL